MISANIPINPLMGYAYYQSVAHQVRKYSAAANMAARLSGDHGPAAIVDLSPWANDVLEANKESAQA